MDLSKFTDEYIAETDPNELRQERKNLIRHVLDCNDIELKLRERLTAHNEEQSALQDLAEMPPARRRALQRIIDSQRATGTGTVSPAPKS